MRKLFTIIALCCLPAAAGAQVYTTFMNGPGEAPAPGDPNGTGVASVRIDGTTVHWTLVVRDINPPTGAHIHRASAGTPGNVVVPFSPLNFVNGVASGSTSGVSPSVIDAIKADPAGHYVNVHTSDFGGGAIRGQLEQGCISNDITLCLNGNRFRVNASWEVPDGGVGVGHGVKLTSDTGYFWFFNEANVEVTLKSLNACEAFARHWVFLSGLTNVEVDLTVIDTQTGGMKRYQNSQGTIFETNLDTDAFPCP